jgi:hypothetical protein
MPVANSHPTPLFALPRAEAHRIILVDLQARCGLIVKHLECWCPKMQHDLAQGDRIETVGIRGRISSRNFISRSHTRSKLCRKSIVSSLLF